MRFVLVLCYNRLQSEKRDILVEHTPEGRIPFVHHGSHSFLDYQIPLFPAALTLHPQQTPLRKSLFEQSKQQCWQMTHLSKVRCKGTRTLCLCQHS